MEIASCHVPFEVLECTFRLLELQDIKATRQVCRVFNSAASHFLIRSAWISTQPPDWQRLKAISEHDIFSKSVREIIYDATYYERDLTHVKTYLRRLKIYDTGHEEHDPKYSRESALRGHGKYQERFLWQQKALDRGIQGGSHGEAYRRLSKGLLGEGDLASLVRALGRMPRVQTLGISCRRNHSKRLRRRAIHKWYCQPLEYSLEDTHNENLIAAVLHPRPFSLDGVLPERHLYIWDRALALMDMASHASKLQPIKNVTLDVLGGTYDYYDSEDALHLPWRANVYQTLSTSLTNVSLNLLTIGKMSRFVELGGNGNILNLLSASPNLTSLSLSTYPTRQRRGIVDLENLLGLCVWRSLRTVRLQGMGVEEDQLLGFLLRHQGSLQHLELVFVGLLTMLQYLKPPYDQFFDVEIWGNLFTRMTALNLEFLLIRSLWTNWADVVPKAQKHTLVRMWCGDNREEIQEFLSSHGEGIISELGAFIFS